MSPTRLSIGSCALVVFARAPQHGRVKTRLAATLGDDAALAIYRDLGARVMHAVTPLAAQCTLMVAGTPDDAEHALRRWLADDLRFDPQGEGDLGARMASAIHRRLASGAARVVVIGTDCPDISAAVVHDAFERLLRHDAVLGPASDGGYYLVGVRRENAVATLHALFTDIPWSSPRTLAVTLERAAEQGVSVARLRELRDIDTAEDWRAWRLGQGEPMDEPPLPDAPATRAASSSTA